MTSQHDKAKRWRPRFSVRTLVIVVTLVCCYAACWGPTKKWGVEDVNEYLNGQHTREVNPFFLQGANASARSPLVAGLDETITWYSPYRTTTRRHYYFWFFGYVAKLPYEREVVLPRLGVSMDIVEIQIERAAGASAR